MRDNNISRPRDNTGFAHVGADIETKRKIVELKRLFTCNEVFLMRKVIEFYIAGNKSEIRRQIDRLYEGIL